MSRPLLAAVVALGLSALPAVAIEEALSCQARGTCGEECHDGAAYLQTGQIGKSRRRTYPMCVEADSACNHMTGQTNGTLRVAEVEKVLQSGGAFRAFLLTAKVFEKVGGLLRCKELCEKTVDYLEQQGVTIPEAPHRGCYPIPPLAENKVRCDYDLSPKTISGKFGTETGLIPSAEKGGAGIEPSENLFQQAATKANVHRHEHGAHEQVHAQTEKTPTMARYAQAENDFTQAWTFRVQECAERILYLFHVYPKAWVTYGPAEFVDYTLPGMTETWVTMAAKNNLVSRAYLTYAIAFLYKLNAAKAALVDEYFGEAASKNVHVMAELLRVMNSVMEVVNSAQVVFAPDSPNCEPGLYAFVYPRSLKGVPTNQNSGEEITTSAADRKVVYFCDFYFDYNSHGQWESVQTMLHESSHHGTAYTMDVGSCKENVWLHLDSEKASRLWMRDKEGVLIAGAWHARALGKDILAIANKTISEATDGVDENQEYYMDTLRFSQDGRYILTEISPTYMDPYSCPVAYGPKACKQLAKESPYKTLLNADSFGYYIIAASGMFFQEMIAAL